MRQEALAFSQRLSWATDHKGLGTLPPLIVGASSAFGVIAVATLLGAGAVQIVDFDHNSQVTARVAPRVIDLLVALAAGAAGAFAMSRDDVADSIPGVAISIALVPPLCVVGLSLAAGQWLHAWGALLLFLTNFLSILLAGGGVFALSGLGAAATAGDRQVNKGRAYRIIAFGVLLIAIPLSATTVRVFRESIAQARINEIANQWVRQYRSDLVIRSVLVSGGAAQVLMTGSERPATMDDLAGGFDR